MTGRGSLVGWVIALAIFSVPIDSHAAPIELTILNPATEVLTSAIFEGTVTNNTGSALSTADIFLNFFAFDPIAIANIEQLLGIPDFVINEAATSAITPLFEVTLAPGLQPGATYSIGVFAQDVNDNFSDDDFVSVSVATPPSDVPQIPEPASGLLVLTGVALYRYCRGSQQSRS